ncbi:UPF0488 protein CG14286 [Euwallacea fornicatus]|uniref:UPF0488 protein CG14286 n=1 Tax=Euwallacea fornicatus TaxID=995702 RepID=UPI00338D54E2
MSPRKAKLHKVTGKAKVNPSKLPIPQMANSTTHTAQPNTHSVNPATGLTGEQEEQFQSELYWCIKQLQSALSTGKLPSKYVQDHTKALNTLMSNASPMVKKRQVMRLSFGDYRSKMLEDEKKAKKISIKMSVGEVSDKSQFLRKALSGSGDFKFSFPPPPSTVGEDTIEGENSPGTTRKIVMFPRSDNGFRFNFANKEGE